MGEVYATVTIYTLSVEGGRLGYTSSVGRGGRKKGFGMMVSSFFATIMSAHGRDLYSYASNDLLVVLWAVKKGKEKEKSVRKAIPMAGQW